MGTSKERSQCASDLSDDVSDRGGQRIDASSEPMTNGSARPGTRSDSAVREIPRPELLAPLGRLSFLDDLLASGADAVYFGGKRFNMRMHRREFNLTDDEIVVAVSQIHAARKKAYLTFNNMMTDRELVESVDFVTMVIEAGVDAVIVQDMGAISLLNSLPVSVPLHASVMMNVHSVEMIRALQSLGVSRIVASREATLETVKRWREETGIETEYFIHGDMCFANGAQCLYSGFTFGKSSNRGLCMKPCRWPYRLRADGRGYIGGDGSTKSDLAKGYLAINDMCLYEHIRDLVAAGIASFKIEGRMRGPDYLCGLIALYREAIDRYFEDPIGYTTDPIAVERLKENRVRELSTCYAFGNPGRSAMGYDLQREPRIFSHATKEPTLSASTVRRAVERLNMGGSQEGLAPGVLGRGVQGLRRALLAVRVNTVDSAIASADAGADLVYIGGDTFRPNCPVGLAALRSLVASIGGDRVCAMTPRMTLDSVNKDLARWAEGVRDAGIDTVVAGNLGALAVCVRSGMKVVGDYPLSIYNRRAALAYLSSLRSGASFTLPKVSEGSERDGAVRPAKRLGDFTPMTRADMRLDHRGLSADDLGMPVTAGLERVTVSVEATADVVRDLCQIGEVESEIIVHGAPSVMYADHCVYGAAFGPSTREDFCSMPCMTTTVSLEDESGGLHPTRVDQYCRTHVLPVSDLCLLPLLPWLLRLGYAVVRLELPHMTARQASATVGVYRRYLDDAISGVDRVAEPQWCQEWIDSSLVAAERLASLTGRGVTAGPIAF